MLLGRFSDQFKRQAQSSAGGELRSYNSFSASGWETRKVLLEIGGLYDSAIGSGGTRRAQHEHAFCKSLLTRDVSFLGNEETKTRMVH